MRRAKARTLIILLMVGILLFAVSTPALAADSPEEDAAWFMADWLVISYLLFTGSGVLVFLFALKMGAFRNTEQAKYYMLTIEEPDYYTPAWAKEEADGGATENAPENHPNRQHE